MIMCLYVDDMLIVGSNDKMVKSTKDILHSRFHMKDMGLADVILGIKILRTSSGYTLNQSHYVDKILEKFIKMILVCQELLLIRLYIYRKIKARVFLKENKLK